MTGFAMRVPNAGPCHIALRPPEERSQHHLRVEPLQILSATIRPSYQSRAAPIGESERPRLTWMNQP